MTVRALIESGRLGRVTHFESHFDRFRPKVPQRWREEASRGGGLLFDLGPHLIDQALTLFGAPQTVSRPCARIAITRTRRITCISLLGYGDKEVVLHASALAALEPPRFAIHGTRGSYVKNGLDTQEDQLKAGLRPGDAGFAQESAGRAARSRRRSRSASEFATRDGAYVELLSGAGGVDPGRQAVSGFAAGRRRRDDDHRTRDAQFRRRAAPAVPRVR